MKSPEKIILNSNGRLILKKLILIPLVLLSFGIGSITYAEGDATRDQCSTLYAGMFIDSAGSGNQLIDVRGFANWGKPGSVSNYETDYQGGGIFLGNRMHCSSVPLRFEVGLHLGKPTAQTNQLDPAAEDETAVAEFEQLSSFRLGIEQELGGDATLILNAGLAHSKISNSVTDIDFNRTYPDGVFDPDDSFSDTSSKFGWVLGFEVETPVNMTWRLRVGGSLFDFGKETYYVNTSGNNPCGAGGTREACPYRVHNSLFTAHLALIREF